MVGNVTVSQRARFGSRVVIALKVRQQSGENLTQTLLLHVRNLSLGVLHHYRCATHPNLQLLLNEEIYTLLGEAGQVYREH